MKTLRDFRACAPAFCPDQAVYAAYAAHVSGLDFQDLDGGTSLLFTVGIGGQRAAFGAGRCSFFPQNNATAATLANDKYFAGVLMARSGIATLGGDYFFLHDRHRAHRPPGHERGDAIAHCQALGGAAFVKPLNGSRGDFAQAVSSETALRGYLDEVARYHDAIIMQRIYVGQEYRIFVLDDEILYSARKAPPVVIGDGEHSFGALLRAAADQRSAHGVSLAASPDSGPHDVVLAQGERRAIPGRMNRSAGGTMDFATPDNDVAAFAIARQAVKALGLRVGAVDMFTDAGSDPAAMRVIEVNANPSIRFLEDSGRDDLILRIWQSTFQTVGLRDV
ncbi:MAG: hypothetical protein ABW213_04575 [Tardiphaga sp.]